MLAILLQTVKQASLQNITSEDKVYYQIWLPEQGPSNKNQTYLQKIKTTNKTNPQSFKVPFETKFFSIAAVNNISVLLFYFYFLMHLDRSHQVRA